MTDFKLLWQIPLAVLSLGFYKVSKVSISQIYALYLAITSRKAVNWRVLSAETLQNPLGLPVIMTKGPRWNTHAIVATLAPIAIRSQLAVDVRSAQKSAASWTVVVYSYPDYRTIANLGSLSSADAEDWAVVTLPPGKYALVLRYYEWGEAVQLPAIQVDDRELVGVQPLNPQINEFLKDLKQIKNGFYLALHYYVFVLLKLRHRLPEAWIRREFLPVGDRDNQFGYGYCQTGDQLQFEFSASLLADYVVYLTLYNRSSFPIFWSAIATQQYQTEPLTQDGFYLLRFRARSSDAPKLTSLGEGKWAENNNQ
jgi:hypothetical protein